MSEVKEKEKLVETKEKDEKIKDVVEEKVKPIDKEKKETKKKKKTNATNKAKKSKEPEKIEQTTKQKKAKNEEKIEEKKESKTAKEIKKENNKEEAKPPKKTKTTSKVKKALKETDVTKKVENNEKANIEENKEEIIEKETKTEDFVTVFEKDEKQEEVKKEEIKEEQNRSDENIEKPDFLHKYTKLITIISIILFIGLVVFSTAFGLANRASDKIVSGVSIKGIDVSGLTYKEAEEKVAKTYNEKLKQNIILKHNEYETSLTAEQIESNFGIKEALDTAYGIGRSGKVLKDNYTILNVKLNKIDISPSYSYNEKVLTDFIESTSENLPDKVKQSSYSVEANKLIITKGEKGNTIDTEQLKKIIVNNIVDINNNESSIEMPVKEIEPDAIDVEKIHNEIYKEPKDASYTLQPFAVYPHEDGVDFAITIDEAKQLLNTEEQEITIPLKISKPKVTTNQIGTEAFPDLLATYSTTFATSNTNRATNIRLAVNKINGYVLVPGQEFSYNTIVGQRTKSAGFREAGVYVNGKVETGVGGGICQVSSTLYNSVLRANLEIIKRSNHTFATGYVPLSTDATVSWGGPEFIFKNTRKYPIRVVASVVGGRIKVDIYGHKEDKEYEVIIKSETLQTIPMKTETRVNPALPAGTTKTVQKGHPGYKSRAYRILKLNGQVVSTQLLSTDTYAQLSTVIEKN